jgi:hypothetical protein
MTDHTGPRGPRSAASPDTSAPLDPTTMDPRDIATLRAIMQALRTPVTGCPWDLEQDFATIAPIHHRGSLRGGGCH